MNEKKHNINTKDVIANFRGVDNLLLKVIDFFLSVPFLANPLLWKVLIVIYILTVPLSAVVSTFSTFFGIAYVFMGNTIGIIVLVIIVAYIVWLSRSTLFNQESDFKIADLKGWSKVLMVAVVLSLLISAAFNIWISNIAWAITVVIRYFVSITLTMYLVPFFCRYFLGVVIDGLKHHPESTHNSNGEIVNDDDISVVKD
jgi:hypothetical protein